MQGLGLKNYKHFLGDTSETSCVPGSAVIDLAYWTIRVHPTFSDPAMTPALECRLYLCQTFIYFSMPFYWLPANILYIDKR